MENYPYFQRGNHKEIETKRKEYIRERRGNVKNRMIDQVLGVTKPVNT